MTKFELTLDTGEHEVTEKEVIKKISESFEEGEVVVDRTGEATGRTHRIYSESDVPCRIYYDFDGYEDLEYSHIERKTTHYGDEVISQPLQENFLYCTCGDLNLASPEEALEHLRNNSSTGLKTVDPQIDVSIIEEWTVMRQGKTAKTRRPEEFIHLNESSGELVTFVPVRAESNDSAIEQAFNNVMFPDEWHNSEIVHSEGDEIRVVRLTRGGSFSDIRITETETDTPSYERGMRNFSTNEIVTFVSASGTSSDDALEKARGRIHIKGDGNGEIIHQEDHIYLIRFTSSWN